MSVSCEQLKHVKSCVANVCKIIHRAETQKCTACAKLVHLNSEVNIYRGFLYKPSSDFFSFSLYTTVLLSYGYSVYRSSLLTFSEHIYYLYSEIPHSWTVTGQAVLSFIARCLQFRGFQCVEVYGDTCIIYIRDFLNCPFILQVSTVERCPLSRVPL